MDEINTILFTPAFYFNGVAGLVIIGFVLNKLCKLTSFQKLILCIFAFGLLDKMICQVIPNAQKLEISILKDYAGLMLAGYILCHGVRAFYKNRLCYKQKVALNVLKLD